MHASFFDIFPVLGGGSNAVHVEAFSDTIDACTGADYVDFVDSLCKWREAFASERNRLAAQSKELEALNKRLEKNLNEEDKAECEAEVQRLNNIGFEADLPPPRSWPIHRHRRDDDRFNEGIPALPLLMKVDSPESVKYERNLTSYKNHMNSLPARVLAEMASMFADAAGASVPLGVMLSEGSDLSHGVDRQEQFENVQETMRQFNPAKCLCRQWEVMLETIKGTEDPVAKVDSLETYMRQAIKQVQGIALAYGFNSESIKSANDYVMQGNHTVCRALQSLWKGFVDPRRDMGKERWRSDTDLAMFWQTQQTSSFQQYHFVVESMIASYNSVYFNLMPQNLFIAKEHQISSIMYRLGMHNHGFTWIGMLNIIADGGMKLVCKNGAVDTRKSPSAGVDLVREFLDYWRQMGVAFLGLDAKNDDQRFNQMKRATELGLTYGFVMCIGHDIKTKPNKELAQDHMATEGLQGDVRVYNQLINLIPRDGNMDATLVTTVDLDKTNVR